MGPGICKPCPLQATLASELPEGVLRQQAPLDRYEDTPNSSSGEGCCP